MQGDRNDGRRRRQLAVLAPALAVVLVSCGSGPGASSDESASPGPHGEFLSQVDGICARAVAVHAGHSFPVDGFDPQHPDPNQLPDVGNYLARYGGLPATDAAFHRLNPPATDADAWRHLLHLADKITTNAQRQITAARDRNVAGFVHTLSRSHQLTSQINTAGRRFGFTQNSACGQVFG